MRTLKKSETFNETSNQYQYPQTPSRLQMSLWPAGQPSNAKGTIEWAGGVIDWNSQDIQDYGYDFAVVGEVSVECYDPPVGANINGNKSYIYTDIAATNDTIEITDKDTVLASFAATGANMTIGASSSSSSSSSSSTPSASNTSNTIPEIHGGTGNEPGNNGNSGGSGSGGSGGSGGGSDSFSQGGDDNDSNDGSDNTSAAASQNERVLRGSFFAVLVAIVVLVTL